MVTVHQTYLVYYDRVGGVGGLGLSSLTLGCNFKFSSENIEELRCQGISVDDDSNPVPDNIPYQAPQ